ncbi:MAG: hypothetical protein LH473_13640 [Chitinophagales bacterium]|nr:hypothetical protein [Chitinophagales bacterium]
MKKYILFSILISSIQHLHAAIWHVGPSQVYTKPSQVSSLVQNGDTVNIDAATYTSDVAYWNASDLLIRGIGGYAYLQSNGASYGGKAIWVIGGSNTTVEWIEFSGCSVPDHNGAGIRQEGKNLTVRHCYFHDNEEGILAGTVNPSNILIEYTEFDHNGYGDGYSHNLYINNIDTLTFQFNYSHHAVVGHELKSRAHVNFILYNRISNEATGTASREIDLPNGGTSILIGNEIEQGANSENSNIIGYGLEGLTNPSPHEIYLANNTIVNDKSSGTFLQLQTGTSLLKSYNNIFAGSGTLLSGTATSVDTSNNWRTVSIASVSFSDASNYDYHLLNLSPAIDKGANAGNTNSGFSLLPLFEYVDPANSILRMPNGNIDLGGYEFSFPLNISNAAEISNSISVIQNNENEFVSIASQGLIITEINLFKINGGKIFSNSTSTQSYQFYTSSLISGIYILDIKTKEGVNKTIKLFFH